METAKNRTTANQSLPLQIGIVENLIPPLLIKVLDLTLVRSFFNCFYQFSGMANRWRIFYICFISRKWYHSDRTWKDDSFVDRKWASCLEMQLWFNYLQLMRQLKIYSPSIGHSIKWKNEKIADRDGTLDLSHSFKSCAPQIARLIWCSDWYAGYWCCCLYIFCREHIKAVSSGSLARRTSYGRIQRIRSGSEWLKEISAELRKICNLKFIRWTRPGLCVHLEFLFPVANFTRFKVLREASSDHFFLDQNVDFLPCTRSKYSECDGRSLRFFLCCVIFFSVWSI